MARAITQKRKNHQHRPSLGVSRFLIFFPILWTILTSFKTEAQGDGTITEFFRALIGTLAKLPRFWSGPNYGRFLWNSIIIAGGLPSLVILIAVPAAWSMAFVALATRNKTFCCGLRTTKMLPAVRCAYPIYLLCIQFGRVDSKDRTWFIISDAHQPADIVWHAFYTYFREIPARSLEAARMAWASCAKRCFMCARRWPIRGIASTLLVELYPRVERKPSGTLQPHRGQGPLPAHRLHRELLQPRSAFSMPSSARPPRCKLRQSHPRLSAKAAWSAADIRARSSK